MTDKSTPQLRRSLKPLLRFLPYFAAYKSRILFAVSALAVASGTTLVIPLIARQVVDLGFSSQNATLVNGYFIAMLVMAAILALSSSMRFYFVSWIGERVVADVRNALFNHLMKLNPSFYETQKSGDIVSRLTADTTLIRSAFSSSVSMALRSTVTLIGALVMMVYTSPSLAGLGALAIPAAVLPPVIYGRRVRKLARKAQDLLAASAAFAQERVSGIVAVQANTQEPDAINRFSKSTIEAFDAARTRSLARAILTFTVIIVSFSAVVALLWYGTHEVLGGRISGGTLTQFLIYAVIGANSLATLSELWGELQQAAGASERISELLDERPLIVSPADPVALRQPVTGSITFSKVQFTYPSNPEKTILSNVSFKATPNEVIALVGPSGAGKSTIYTLLQRFQEPNTGTILIDGIDVSKLSLEELRGSIAIVPQDPTIFSGTIAENIRLGKPDATQAEVEAAARAAYVDEFVRHLPAKYESLLGERGITLSGGQRQRLAIARAILRNAPVLLLDEATSSLDAESEALIQQALEQISKGRTTLVIAHRLATVRNADKIIVIDKGKVAAQGTHRELLKKSSLYARLAKLQFSV